MKPQKLPIKPPREYRYKGYRFPFSSKTLLMGVVNVTPDSFSDDGISLKPADAMKQVDRLMADGADIIDIGGESSRPGAKPVSVAEERKRIAPVIRRIVKKYPEIPVSIDTTKAEVAMAALNEGAAMINDISGMAKSAMRKLAAKAKIPVVIMHMKGAPQTMQKRPAYLDVIGEIKSFFKKRIELCLNAGITKIVLDPGIGFGKTVKHNLIIINRLDQFLSLGYPVMIGASRKSFIGAILDLDVDEREEGTLAISALAVMRGASIVRVHDVAKNRLATKIAKSVINERF